MTNEGNRSADRQSHSWRRMNALRVKLLGRDNQRWKMSDWTGRSNDQKKLKNRCTCRLLLSSSQPNVSINYERRRLRYQMTSSYQRSGSWTRNSFQEERLDFMESSATMMAAKCNNQTKSRSRSRRTRRRNIDWMNWNIESERQRCHRQLNRGRWVKSKLRPPRVELFIGDVRPT